MYYYAFFISYCYSSRNSVILVASYRITTAVTRTSELDCEKLMVCLGDWQMYGRIMVSVYVQRSGYMKLWHYCVEQRRGPSMSVSNTKKLEAAHHRWQRKILKISWKDMITNKAVRETTGQDTLESVIRERRLRCHVCRMDSNRTARQAMDWIPSDFKKKRRRPRVSWTSTIKKDLNLLGLTWEEALDLTKDRSDWGRLYCPMWFYSARND